MGESTLVNIDLKYSNFSTPLLSNLMSLMSENVWHRCCDNPAAKFTKACYENIAVSFYEYLYVCVLDVMNILCHLSLWTLAFSKVLPFKTLNYINRFLIMWSSSLLQVKKMFLCIFMGVTKHCIIYEIKKNTLKCFTLTSECKFLLLPSFSALHSNKWTYS